METTAEALADPLWVSHKVGDIYIMDGEPGWKIAYYPLLGEGEPKALVERPKRFGGTMGTDFREVPLRYLQRDCDTSEPELDADGYADPNGLPRGHPVRRLPLGDRARYRMGSKGRWKDVEARFKIAPLRFDDLGESWAGQSWGIRP